MSEDMPDRMSEDMPDRKPEDMPDRMSEDMPDKLSFPHLHGSEMVYHILKPEIFTTNAMGTSFQTHQDGPFPTIQKRNHHHQHIRKNVRRYAR